MASKRVLIVDDEENIGRSLRMILEREGYAVNVCRSVAEFRKHPDAQRADAYLLDMKLPDGSGIDLLKLVKQNGAAPAVMISGHGTIADAVEATRRWSTANTNLGIILLSAPLARAALDASARPLRARVRDVLAGATVDDARRVYAAIRLAAPGGLGSASEQDVHAEPTLPLTATMALAAERDAVAAEYATAFERTFTTGAPAVTAALEAGLGWADATVEAFLTLLAGHPDTLIVRKLGAAAAEGVRCEAVRVLGAGGVRSAEGRGALAAFDGSLRDPRNRRNPGTTADLTAAALLVVILERGWRAGGEVDRLLRADR